MGEDDNQGNHEFRLGYCGSERFRITPPDGTGRRPAGNARRREVLPGKLRRLSRGRRADGRGIAAPSLGGRIADFTNPDFWKNSDDGKIVKVILRSGPHARPVRQPRGGEGHRRVHEVRFSGKIRLLKRAPDVEVKTGRLRRPTFFQATFLRPSTRRPLTR